MKFFNVIILIVFLLNIQLNKSSLQERILICGKELCFPRGSICNIDTCLCRECYLTIKSENDHLMCNYMQKSGISGFLWEFFLPFGSGHIYLGNYTYTFIKIFFFVLCFIGGQFIGFHVILLVKSYKADQLQRNRNYMFELALVEEEMKKVRKIELYMKLIFLLYHIYDLGKFIFNIHKDSNNIPTC